jgi:hypothetical protein
MPSLFSQYISETFGKRIIEDEHGYATYYRIPDTSLCYIEDIFVVPEQRQNKKATSYEVEVTKWAQSNGCTHLLGSVNTRISTPERSLLMLLHSGYKFSHIDGHVIYFSKEI